MGLRRVRSLDPMPLWPTAVPLALGTGEFSLMLLLLIAVVVPVAAIAFARSGKGLDELGKGTFAVDFAEESDSERDEELRQLVEARAWRRERRGEEPGDTEAEISRLLELDPEGARKAEPPAAAGSAAPVGPERTVDGTPGNAGPMGHLAAISPTGDGNDPTGGVRQEPVNPPDDGGLREEVRQVVVARNESRLRRGEAPLEVEAEIERLLRDLT